MKCNGGLGGVSVAMAMLLLLLVAIPSDAERIGRMNFCSLCSNHILSKQVIINVLLFCKVAKIKPDCLGVGY